MVVADALTLPEELRKASGLSVHTLRRLRPHHRSGTYADPKTGMVYTARLNAIGAVSRDGYVRVGRPTVGGEQYAHRIVFESVHGPIAPGHQIDHRNHQRADNRIANLREVTPLQNVHASIRRGRIPRGEAVRNSRLTDSLVRQIRSPAGVRSDSEWADQLGIDRKTISDARRGRSWRHVKPCPRLRSRQRPRHQKDERT